MNICIVGNREMKGVEICEKLSGEYAEELYRDILAGK